jgi:tRNA A37 threonylcarbamoyladenosine synthetase subunit TsaC/SUA5/YrdC
VRRRFGKALDCIVAGAVGPDHGSATEIRRAQNNALLRPGR